MSSYQQSQSRINVIGALTRFIDDFNKKDFGTIEITTKNASKHWLIKEGYPIPKASYSESVRKFIITCKSILQRYPEYRGQRYKYHDFDIKFYTTTDDIINEIFAVIDAESYCDGPLMEYLQSGRITSWLIALRERLDNIAGVGAIQGTPSYGVDELTSRLVPIEAVSEEGFYLGSLKYTVEPADEECRRFLNNDRYTTWKRDISGGVGMHYQHMKLFDYGRSEYPALSDFLDQLVYIAPTKELSPEQRRSSHGNKTGAYPSYYSNDRSAIKKYLVEYIETFASGASVDVLSAIENYGGSFDTDYFGRNIVLNERYFEGIFHRCSQIVAKYLFEESLLNSIISDIGNSGFVGAFERLCRIELFFIDCPGLFHFDDYSFYGGFYKKEKCFVCNKIDYYSSIKPFILFLSNFRLILSVYMAINLYGQCHFSICWETDSGEDMPPEKWPHPSRG